MTKQEYKQNAYNLIYLIACVVNDKIPEKEKLDRIDLSGVLAVAKKHSLGAIAAYALDSADVFDKRYKEAKGISISKNINHEIERAKILEEFEKAGIWYLPLKGIIMKEYYPKAGMREMCDNDILFDKRYVKKVKNIMTKLEFKMVHDDSGHDIAFIKEPLCNFEMHTELLGNGYDKTLNAYYSDVKARLIKEYDKDFCYHFSDDDFYIFMTAHEYIHYSSCGTGLRSLLDCYIFEKEKGATLNKEYIASQLEKLGISEFEKERRELAMKIFSSTVFPELNDSETEMFMYYMTAGTYGNIENAVNNNLKDQSKFSFWLHKIFISPKKMANYHPFTRKSILLYPVGFVWHIIRALTLRRKRFIHTIKAVNKYGK